MLIAVISDIHDNIANLDLALKTINMREAKVVLCLGDMTNSDTLAHLAANFSGQIHIIKGNCDLWHDEEADLYPNIHYLGRCGTVELDGTGYGLCHEPRFIKGLKENNEEKENHLSVVFYGHTHKPWESVDYGVRTINPGNIAGVIYPSTFAVYDTDKGKAELIML